MQAEQNLFMNTIKALSAAVDAKDRYTSGHSQRVASYSKLLAERLGKDEQYQEMIYFAGLLHDIGKIRIPEEIHNKPGKQTDDEFARINSHPSVGYHIIKSIAENEPMIAEAVKFHHEKYDGTGYPNHLEGENIPEVARIMAVADSYDAMASNRSYRKALPQEVVRMEIEKGKGTQFDPVIADIMLAIIDEDTEYKLQQTDSLVHKILVVDDEPMNSKMVQFILKDENMYEVGAVNSGLAAIDSLRTEPVELVFLDIEMPGMDGFATLEGIRQFSDVPIVFMTANKELETIRRATNMGVEDYITKPFFPTALKEVLHSILT